MSNVRTRGISLVRTVSVTKPNRKEPELIRKQFTVRCNAAIPLDHKDFQNQYLFEDLKPDIPAPKKQKVENKKKLEKWKKALL